MNNKVVRFPSNGSPRSVLSQFLDEIDNLAVVAVVVEDNSGQIQIGWSEANTSMLALMSMAFDDTVRSSIKGLPDE